MANLERAPLPSSIVRTAIMASPPGSMIPSPIDMSKAVQAGARGGLEGVNDIVEQINWQSVPMPGLPPLHRFASSINGGLKHTSMHEVAHTAMARIKGIEVKSVSVIADGSSLGRTVFSGHVSFDSFREIAAASSVVNHFGRARGYGGDFAQIGLMDLLENRPFGSSIYSSRMKAEATLNSHFSPQELKNMAIILAFCQVLGSDSIGSMMARASFEAKLQREGKLHLLDQAYDGRKKTPVDIETVFDPVREEGNYTVIDHYADGSYRLTYYTDGKVIGEEFICRFCGGLNGHSPDCVAVKKPESIIPINERTEPMGGGQQGLEPKIELVPRGGSSIPRGGVIFGGGVS